MKREVDFVQLRKEYEQGNPLVLETLREAGFFLGKGVANVINLLNPQAVVIGGNWVEVFLNTLRRP